MDSCSYIQNTQACGVINQTLLMLVSFYSTFNQAWYCSSLTFSIQSTVLPLRCSRMAMCVMAVVGVAPCQCFSPGGHQTTSPGRISSFGPLSLCTHPSPEVTIRVCPSGCVCHAVRAPGSNVTLTPSTRAGSGAWNSGSMRTVPVKYSSGPFPEGCEPARLMSIVVLPVKWFFSPAPAVTLPRRAPEGLTPDR